MLNQNNQNTAQSEDYDSEVSSDYDPEKEVFGNWKIVDLPIITIRTGQENEQIAYRAKASFYRWKDDEWKQRGIGEFKLLQDKSSKLTRVIARAEKTYRIMLNHYLQTEDGVSCRLLQSKVKENAWNWGCMDISEGHPQYERFCIKLDDKAESLRFKEEFQKAYKINAEIYAKGKQTKQIQGAAPKQVKQVIQQKCD